MTDSLVILDGGTGRELARRGAPFRQPEWSALARIEAEAAKALASPEMAKLFTERAFDPMPIPRAELPGFVAGESQRWRDAVRQSGAKAE